MPPGCGRSWGRLLQRHRARAAAQARGPPQPALQRGRGARVAAVGGRRYVVPLVFNTMLRRWTTVRAAVAVWPHRPLPPTGRPGDPATAPAELQQILVADGVARSTEVPLPPPPSIT